MDPSRCRILWQGRRWLRIWYRNGSSPGRRVFQGNLDGAVKSQAAAIVEGMQANHIERLPFIRSMNISGEVAGERSRIVSIPCRDFAAVVEASNLDYTV